jgi:hypothetical protein
MTVTACQEVAQGLGRGCERKWLSYSAQERALGFSLDRVSLMQPLIKFRRGVAKREIIKP